jgi:hypothetical protein
MRKIKVENELGLEVYINGTPDLKQLPKDEYDLFITALTKSVIECIKEERMKNKVTDESLLCGEDK